MEKEFGIFRKISEAIAIACLLLHMFRHLGDLLTIKILKGRIKKEYCQDSDILGFCENYLKLLHALYNCAANISRHGLHSPHQGPYMVGSSFWSMSKKNRKNVEEYYFNQYDFHQPWGFKKNRQQEWPVVNKRDTTTQPQMGHQQTGGNADLPLLNPSW